MLLAIAGASGCNPQAVSTGRFPFAVAHPDCGPADGPALRVVLADSPVVRAPHRDPSGEHLVLMINGGLGPALRHQVTVTSEGRGRPRTATAAQCDGAGRCRLAESGWIRLRSLVAPARGDTTLNGEYEFRLSAGPTVRGRFSAGWVGYSPLCG